MEFKCSSCNYTTPIKLCIDRHITKIKKCGINPTIITINGSILCEYCNIVCKTKRLINDHYKVCKILKKLETNQLEQLIITNNISIPLTIPLRSYTDPKIPDNINDICEEAWGKMRCVITYIERVYFSEKLPENHSICITNIRAALGTKVFNGSMWVFIDTNNFITEIITNTIRALNKWIMSNHKTNNFRDKYKKYIAGENQNTLTKNIRNELKLLLHKNSKNGFVNPKSTTVVPYINNPCSS